MNNNALILACEKGQKGVVTALLKTKKNEIDKRDNLGNTALHFACEKGNKDIVKLLLQNDAQVDIANNNGVTALHAAYKKRQ